jgi:hypothetical protein
VKPDIARGRRPFSLLSFGDDLFTQSSCPLDFDLELFVNAQGHINCRFQTFDILLQLEPVR